MLRETDHACGQTYTLAAPGRVGAFECGPEGVVEYRPDAAGHRVCHTNHPLASDATVQYRALTGQDAGTVRAGSANSAARLGCIWPTAMQQDRVSVDDLKAALASKADPDHPVSREIPPGAPDGDATFTAGALLCEISPLPKLHFAAGPPSLSRFIEYQFQG